MSTETDEMQHRDMLLQALKIVESGYGGILSNGQIVDRREHPEAIPMQKNTELRVPEPKEIL